MRVLVADDHELVRRGVKELLREQFPGVEVGEAETGGAAFELALKGSWDLMLLDIHMPGRNGLEVLADLRRVQPKLPVLVLSISDESEYAVRVIRAGAAGYLTKQTVGEELAAAVRKIVSGGRYISTGVAEQLAVGVSREGTAPHEKLSVQGDVELARYALKHGLVD